MKTQGRTQSHVLMATIISLILSPHVFGQDLEKGTVEATALVGFVSGIGGTHGVVGGGGGAAIRNRFLVLGEVSYIPLGSNSIDVLGVKSEFSARAITFNFGGQ